MSEAKGSFANEQVRKHLRAALEKPRMGLHTARGPAARALLQGVAMVLFLGMVPLATADVAEPPPPPSEPYWLGHQVPFGYVGFDVQEDHLIVNVTHHRNAYAIDVVLLIGNDTAAEPHEWYIVHFGNTTVAADFEGETPDMTPQGTAWRITREGGAPGDCIKVVAQAWQRIDDEKHITTTLPHGADPVTAWNDLPCHEQGGERATAPDAADPGRFAPAPALPWLIGIAIAGTMLRRR